MTSPLCVVVKPVGFATKRGRLLMRGKMPAGNGSERGRRERPGARPGRKSFLPNPAPLLNFESDTRNSGRRELDKPGSASPALKRRFA
jgi:hypothetical protein